MATTVTKELVLDVLRDLIVAEAHHRSAMNIYCDLPYHQTRLRAERQWHNAKQVAKSVLEIEGRSLKE